MFQIGYLTFPFSWFTECNMLVTEVEPEAPLLWPPGAKSRLIGKDPDVGKDWGAGRERDDRGWDGWMASLTQWTSVWASSKRYWRTGKPSVLQSMRSQRVYMTWRLRQQQRTSVIVPGRRTWGRGRLTRKLKLWHLQLCANRNAFIHKRQAILNMEFNHSDR